jgi:hypothetical protein
MKTGSEIIRECGDNAAKWAKAFCEIVAETAEHPAIAIDEALMLGWFANAIESRPRAPRLTASEAVYGFASWLTTRAERTVMSASDSSAPIATLVDEFCKANDLAAPRDGWTLSLTHPTT